MNTERYTTVPAVLPAQLPAITREQGKRIAYKLAVHFLREHKRWPYWLQRWICDGRRVWVSTTPTQAQNHSKGLGRLVHDVSHEVFEAIYPTRKPHDPLHAKYETDIAAYVAARIDAWVKPPRVKIEPTLAERHMAEYVHNNDHLEAWRAKQRRAANAIKKLNATQRRLERSLIADANRLEIYGSDPL